MHRPRRKERVLHLKKSLLNVFTRKAKIALPALSEKETGGTVIKSFYLVGEDSGKIAVLASIVFNLSKSPHKNKTR